MGSFVEVGTTSELKDGTMKEVSVKGKGILLARISGKYYAAGGHCPHMRGNLSKGKLEGTLVTCPLHGSQFDLTDGHVVRWVRKLVEMSAEGKAPKGTRPLAIYNVKVEGDRVSVEV